MISALLCVAVLTGPAPVAKAKVTPWTEEQLAKIQQLVEKSRETDLGLRLELDAKQRELAMHYAQFDLSEERIQRLQHEILDLQEQILVNYHSLQSELRKVVGRERFQVLKKRIDQLLEKQRASAAAKAAAKSTP